MDKAYDLKALGQMIVDAVKADGLEIAEEAAEKIAIASCKSVVEWVKQSAALSENKVDDVITPFLAYLEPMIETEIKKLIPGGQ